MAVKRLKLGILAAVGTVVVLALVAGIVVWQVVDWDKDDDSGSGGNYVPPVSNSEMGVYAQAAVASDSPHCSEIGKSMLENNGSVADAAIATLLCVGLIQSQSMGIGGGFLAVYYTAETRTGETLNARDRAPINATVNMFDGDPAASARGNLSVAVPGELKGYWELWKEKGKLPWRDLFQPTIKLAEEGFEVTTHAANAMRSNAAVIKNSPTLRPVFVNSATGEVWQKGDIMTRTDLAPTLRLIAEAAQGDVLYQDTELMRNFVADLQEQGGILQEKDMLDYRATWSEPIQMDIAGNFTLFSIPAPGSGALLAFFMKLLSNYETLNPESLVTFQRITEAFKHGFAKRTRLGDPEDLEVADKILEAQRNLTSPSYIEGILPLIFDDRTNQNHSYYGAEFYEPEDHGTAHVCVLGPNGDAIAVTSTVNLYYGSQIRSLRTGIIYNDGMDDFSSPNITNQFDVPPSPNNFIKSGKRPMSSMTPAIFIDNEGRVRLVIGGAGGTKITTAVTQIAIRNLWFGQTIKEAIDARRIHHQLYPMQMQFEDGFNPKLVDGLALIGHNTEQFNVGTSVVQGISRASNGTIYANADFRKEGTVAGF